MHHVLFAVAAVVAGSPAVTKHSDAEPTVQRIETRAVTFIVRDSVAADFKRFLAGEPTQHTYFADR